jgi:class 3 adenylate cyclase
MTLVLQQSFLGSASSSHSRGPRLSRITSKTSRARSSAKIIQFLRRLLSHPAYKIVVDACTVISLFINDVRLVCIEGDGYDFLFDFILIGILSVLVLDTILSVTFRPTFVWSLYFFTDILSSISILFDLSTLWQAFQTIAAFQKGIGALKELRIIRFVRLMQNKTFYRRLLEKSLGRDFTAGVSLKKQQSPIYESKSADEEVERQIENEKTTPALNQVMRQSVSEPVMHQEDRREESRLRGKLTDINTGRLGLLIFACSVAVPLLSGHDDSVPAYRFAAYELKHALQENDFEKFLQSTITYLASDLSSVGWLQTTIDSPFPLPDNWASQACSNNIDASTERWWSFYPFCPTSPARRPIEVEIIRADDFTVIVEKRSVIQWQGILNICRTLFVNLLLLLGCLVFDYDSAKVLLIPISKLVNILREIRINPLSANSLIDEEQRRVAALKMSHETWKGLPWWRRLFNREPRVDEVTSEISKLEATVLKLGSLLTVGFGELGAKAISLSVLGDKPSAIRQVSGQRVHAIFCCITMSDFNTVTEILQDKIVLLFNRIAKIVHGIVDEHNGYIFKNTAGGFLVIWKSDGRPEGQAVNQRLHELAVVCACRITAAIEKCPLLGTYREHPYLKMIIPNYKVRLHIGLHSGIGIEAATETEMKLDATYLGNDVSFAQTLCLQAANVYYTSLLFSHTIEKSLSDQFRSKLCRKIDSVKAGDQVIGLFTIDLDVSELKSQSHLQSVPLQSVRRRHAASSILLESFREKQEKTGRKNAKMDLEIYEPFLQFKQHELLIMRKSHETKKGLFLKNMFKKGFLNYEAGEADVAMKALVQCIASKDERIRQLIAETGTVRKETIDKLSENSTVDGPSLAILRDIIQRKDAIRGFQKLDYHDQ